MKKSVLFVSLILLSFLLQTCREDESLDMGNVQFAFRTSSLANPGGRSLSELPEGSVLNFSILTSTGGNSFEDIAILKFGDQYITEPIPLPKGDYFVDGFLIISPDHEVLYATPTADSPLASLVEHPLPLAFTVTENAITSYDIEVVSIDAHSPRDFGYASFGIEIVASEVFQVSVFTPGENGTLVPTGAQAYILHGEDTVYRNYLQPGINKIAFGAISDESYTLALVEPSCKKYSRTFVLSALLDELNSNPLSVCLPPALTLTAIGHFGPSGYTFEFYPEGYSTVSGKLSIDWGDGSFCEVDMQDDSNPELYSHNYAMKRPYFISVSGDLDAIEDLYIYYVNVTDVSVRHLPKLKGLRIGGGTTPATIDLSHNPELQFVNFSSGNFRSLDFTNNIKLQYVHLTMNANLSTESMDAIIHQFLLHAVNHGTVDGILDMAIDFNLPRKFVGPPSAAGFEELRTLRDNYGWYIYPENF